jgi:hypothetical protein
MILGDGSEKDETAHDTGVTKSPDPGLDPDPESQRAETAIPEKRVSAFRSLGWLDRFLAV